MSDLSKRIRAGCEAAPWVIDEVEKYEAEIERLTVEVTRIRDAAEIAYSEIAFAVHNFYGRRQQLTSHAFIDALSSNLSKCADELRNVLDAPVSDSPKHADLMRTAADSGNPGRVHDEKCRYWTTRRCDCAMAKFVEQGQDHGN